MKKILMVAMMALPIAAMSQATLSKADGAGTERTRPARPSMESVDAVYIDVVVSYDEKEGETVRFELGSEVFNNSSDKESLAQMKELSQKTFKTVPDALAQLTAMNFKFLTSYELVGKNGKNNAHLIFEKRSLGKAMKEEIRQKETVGQKPAPAVPATKTK